MELSTVYMFAGFFFAAYSVVGNDSVQTLGTFIASNINKFKWYYLWMAASAVLIFTLVYGWTTHGGDITYGRLDSIPLPENIRWYHAAAPLVLVLLTRFGIPVSTTFLVLSAFASSVVLEKMLIKSFLGYAVAAVVAYSLWFILSKFLNEHLPVSTKRAKYWRIAQVANHWLSLVYVA